VTGDCILLFLEQDISAFDAKKYFLATKYFLFVTKEYLFVENAEPMVRERIAQWIKQMPQEFLDASKK
jgi:hypothetical protein